MKYCESVFKTQRWKTREVMVGKVGVGGANPIRVQSMTTSNTRDVEATIEQIMRLADAGCEIARVTVQGMKEAESCEGIKNGLIQKGYEIPVVADIHFYPPAAMRVVDFVDKVRINPGNFVDRRATFKVLEYDDQTYLEEIERIDEAFTPLVEKCKRLKRSMRIGTNHGSLSDRIMNRYGDTPFGMVESALEFARVCRKRDYHDFMFSMKASNPVVMIQAYRLLVAEMIKLGWDYPLHLGVTEAGEGEDGRIKSAVGIGALLLDGIGDTIRVSLTEDPWAEIDPCQRLIRCAQNAEGKGIASFIESYRDISAISRRKVQLRDQSTLHRDGTVILPISQEQLHSETLLTEIGCKMQLGRSIRTTSTVDMLLVDRLDATPAGVEIVQQLKQVHVDVVSTCSEIPGVVPLHSLEESICQESAHFALLVATSDESKWERLKTLSPAFILLSLPDSLLHASRRFFEWLRANGIEIPVILHGSYQSGLDDLLIQASSELGSLLVDGLGEGVCVHSDQVSAESRRAFSFNLLQAARMRTSKTEYISCPGCGRTLFDLQTVAKRIRARTGHLPGVKVAIMGCIVNGPGEMADADFGYVGSKPGKVDLYVGKTCVERGIDFADADERLIGLIKAHGRWQEPEISEELSLV